MVSNNQKFSIGFSAISSRRLQKRSTFASSSGASTSSSTQIGDGLVKNTAKINDIAVKACSPPDRSDIDCNFFWWTNHHFKTGL